MTEEMTKLAGEANAIIERDHFVPALIKSAVAHGVPQPKTEQDVADMLEVVNIMMQTKQAAAEGQYPGLEHQFTSNRDFQTVREMAKRARQELDAQFRVPAVNPNLYPVFERINHLGAQQQAAAAQ